MQEVYRIDVIPAYKPWRGGGTYLVKDKEVFDLFEEDMWLPDVDYSSLPDNFKYLAVEPSWDDEKGEIPYVPTGNEDWDNLTTIDENGEEICLEMSMRNILYNADLKISAPYVLLDSVKVYEE